MTTRELIEHLQKYPSDALVVYQLFSEHAVLDADEIEYHPAEAKKFCYRPKNTTETVFKVHSWDRPSDDAQFVSVVELPGN